MSDLLIGFLIVASIAHGIFIRGVKDRTEILAKDMVIVKERLNIETKKLAPDHSAQTYFKENSI